MTTDQTYTITALPERRQKASWLEWMFWFGLLATPVSYAVAWLAAPHVSPSPWGQATGYATAGAMIALLLGVTALVLSLVLFVAAPFAALLLMAAGAPGARRFANLSILIAAAAIVGMMLLNWLAPWAFAVLQDRMPTPEPPPAGSTWEQAIPAPVSHVPFA